MTEFDVVVLGGGLSGIRSALRAAELGGKVCLIEKDTLGRKGFIRRNILLSEIINERGKEQAHWKEHLNKKEKSAAQYSESLEKKLSEAGVVLVKGEGSLASQNEVLVQEENNSQLVKGKSLILASGSEPFFLPTLPHEENTIISIDEISQLEELPEKVLIVGSGKSGAEAAIGFQELGCKVFLCTDSAEILPEMDSEFNAKVEAQLKGRKIKVLANKNIISYFKNGPELEMTLETGIKFTTNLIVMADQRKGVEQNKIAESLGARLGLKGEILVDDLLMSSIPGVYGVGSISGNLVADSVAQEQGKVAAENAMGKKRQFVPEWVPVICRLVQNAGFVGCSMGSALEKGFHPVEGVSEDVGFADAEPESFKIVADKRSKSVVGAQILSSQAGELIPMILLLIKKGVTVPNLAHSSSLEGTRFQGLCEAAKACLKAIKTG
ncbi:MAG: NAD(P)/FAD-dependent oxidoreductase [Nitrospinae bacterium]|nr:NAD(P)/FAD-dependent oxidoreductase [Nitrospinota bacterium]